MGVKKFQPSLQPGSAYSISTICGLIIHLLICSALRVWVKPFNGCCLKLALIEFRGNLCNIWVFHEIKRFQSEVKGMEMPIPYMQELFVEVGMTAPQYYM